jgi:hypothetical protein
MATIHETTLFPGKLDLLTLWMPQQPWFRGGDSPVLVKAGGYRLDDPAGDVGIEVMVVIDRIGAPVTYVVPMTYRGRALTESSEALIGTAEHGVLGQRFVYDATADPVFVRQLEALGCGEVQAQHQSISNRHDPLIYVRGRPRNESTWIVTRVPENADATGHSAAIIATWTDLTGVSRRGTVAVAM